MYTLGINSVFHDSSACIFQDGILLAAAEDERFTGIKYNERPTPFTTYELPFHAISYCLEVAGIHLKEVDHIAFSFNPYLLITEDQLHNTNATTPFYPRLISEEGRERPWNNLFLSYLLNAPAQLVEGYPHRLQKRFRGCTEADWSWHYVDHHISHASSAYFPSPYLDAALLTIDGRGEIAATTYSTAHNNQINPISAVHLPHSLGLLYEKVTGYLGFTHTADEYKVMALASYGKPEFVKDFREIVQVRKDGQYTIGNENLELRFGPARLKNENFSKHHFNIAHSLQQVLEETVLELISWLYEETKQENLCMAGGVALNCALNVKIKDRGPFKKIWVQPASGDSGTALGAAMWVEQQHRKTETRDFVMTHNYWGPEYSDAEIEQFLNRYKITYQKLDDVIDEVANLLASNKIIGWFQGRMEFGPQSLGSRSILASPIDPSLQQRINELKDQTDFRPLAPVVLEEDAAEWFNGATASHFMLFVFGVSPEKARDIPAVKHMDRTTIIQTINKEQHPQYYKLLTAFKEKTGIPILINTSFNALGKPMVCSPRDAIANFWSSPFDALVMGSFLIQKDHTHIKKPNHSHLEVTEVIG